MIIINMLTCAGNKKVMKKKWEIYYQQLGHKNLVLMLHYLK